MIVNIKDYATAFMIYDSEARRLLNETAITVDGYTFFYDHAGEDEYGDYLLYVYDNHAFAFIKQVACMLYITRRIYRNYCYKQHIKGYCGYEFKGKLCYEFDGSCNIDKAKTEILHNAEKMLRETRPELFEKEEGKCQYM